MTEEESKLIEDLKELKETWEIKNKLIKKEERKRICCLILVFFFDGSAIILQLLKITNFAVSLFVIIICLIVSLTYNRYIHKKIKKIIWIDDIKELQLVMDE